MDPKTAIIALAQSEKVKTMILAINNSVNLCVGLPQAQRAGAEHVLGLMVEMLCSEAVLALNATGDKTWLTAEKEMNMAAVMARSGVIAEVPYHLTQALSRVTSLGEKAMAALKEAQLL